MRKSLGGQKSALSPYEINVDNGRLGLRGSVDVGRLMNNNELFITTKNKVITEDFDPSKGLIALLLFNGPSLVASGINPDKDEIEQYRRIMFKVGFNKHPTSIKYKKYLKNLHTIPEEQIEIDETLDG